MQGHRIGERYVLQRPLGRGGMAEVWQAYDQRLDRTVAVKLLVGAADPGPLERFRREALAVSRIAHPNIVAGYDFGTDGGQPYLVMELVDGETLEARLARGPLPARTAVDVTAQLCAALDAAHRAGVIHRDIKPANVIVTPEGTVKVLDFGIARLHDAAAGLTRTATVVGTSHYLAPEQATGGTANERTDLYAVGCLLYAMLTGAPPFPGQNPMGVMYQHLHTPPPPIARPGVPPALAELVDQLLAKQPDQRPAGAAEVRDRLRGLSGLTSVLPQLTPGPAGPGPAWAAGAAGAAMVGRAAVTAAGPVDAPGESDVGRHAAPRDPRSPWLIGAGVAAVAVIVLAFVVLALLPDGQRRATPGTSATPTAPQSPTSSPTPEPTPSATDAAGQLAALRTLIEERVAAGEIDAEAERKLTEELDKIEEELARDRPAEAADRIEELQDKLDELAEEDRVTDGAAQAISESLDRLADLLPEDSGDDRGRGKGKKKDDD